MNCVPGNPIGAVFNRGDGSGVRKPAQGLREDVGLPRWLLALSQPEVSAQGPRNAGLCERRGQVRGSAEGQPRRSRDRAVFLAGHRSPCRLDPGAVAASGSLGVRRRPPAGSDPRGQPQKSHHDWLEVTTAHTRRVERHRQTVRDGPGHQPSKLWPPLPCDQRQPQAWKRGGRARMSGRTCSWNRSCTR